MPIDAMYLYIAVFLTFQKKRVKMAFPAYEMHEALQLAEEYILTQDNLEGLVSLTHTGMEIYLPTMAQKASILQTA